MKTDAYDYVPADMLDRIPRLYQTEKIDDPIVWIKLFTPDSSWSWYLTEFDPDEQMAFGLVVGMETELGYFSREEMRASRGPHGLRVERDLHFKSTPLSEVRKSTP